MKTTTLTPTTSPTKVSALSFVNGLIDANGEWNATGWSQKGQWARFRTICGCLQNDHNIRVLDYGCGCGDLLGILSCSRYTGIDLNPRLIKYAKKKWHDADHATFIQGNVLEKRTYKLMERLQLDAIVASGVFCYPGDASTHWELLKRLYDCASKVLIFNLLTKQFRPNPPMRCWSAWEVLEFIRNLHCPAWEIIASYLANDMTIVLRKKLTHACP